MKLPFQKGRVLTIALKHYVLVVINLCMTFQAVSQTNQFRSAQSGNWTSLTSWEMSPDGTSWTAATHFPDHQDGAIVIRNGHDIVWDRHGSDFRNEFGEIVSTVDELTVDAGASISISSPYSMIIGMPETEGTGVVVNGKFDLNGMDLECNYQLIINGELNVTEGYMSGLPIVINSSAVLNASGTSSKNFGGIINYGTVNIEDDSYHFNTKSLNYGNWNDRTVDLHGGTDGMTNDGIYTKFGGIRVFSAIPMDGSGTIAGYGTIENSYLSTTYNKVNPGLPIGTLLLKSYQTVNVNELTIELNNSDGPGNGHDLIQVDGNFSIINGTLNVLELATMPFGSYTIIESLQGTFNVNFSTTNLPAGYQIQYTSNSVVLVKADPSASGYFRSAQSGNWTDLSSWEFSADSSTWTAASRFPIHSDESIRILNGHTIAWNRIYEDARNEFDEVIAAVDDLIVDNGATLTVNSSYYLLIGLPEEQGDGITINGTLEINGGSIECNYPLIINGQLAITAGGISGSPTIVSSAGTLTATGPATKGFMGMQNFGIVNLDQGDFYFSAAPANYGNWYDRTSGSFTSINGFTNNGIYHRYGGTRIFDASYFSGSGTVRGYGFIEFLNGTTSVPKVHPGDGPASFDTLVLKTLQPITIQELNIELQNADGPGVGHDLLQLRGNFTLNGSMNVTEFSNLPTGEYLIVQSLEGALTGSFSNTSLPAGYSIQYNPNSVVLLKTSPAQFRNISVNNAGTVVEGASGQKEMLFIVRLNSVSSGTVNVQYSTVDSTAIDGSDYLSLAGTLVFEPGRLRDTIRIPIIGDKIVESDEFVKLQLSAPVNGTIIDGEAYGMIRNDDSYPAIIFTNKTIREGDVTDSLLEVKVRLSASYPEVVSVQFQTRDSLTNSGDDYIPSNGTLVFLPGDTLAYIPILIKGDRIDESNEILLVDLSTPLNARLNNATGRITIIDNDQLPRVLSANVNIPEGNTNDNNLINLTVRLNRAYPLPVTVRYTTMDSTAIDGSDYQSVSGTIIFNPEDTLEIINIPVIGDGIVEGNEIIKLVLDQPVNATVAAANYRINLTNDDSYPTINAIAANATEVDNGIVAMQMKIRISKRYPEDISVLVNSSDLTALSGIDYASFSQQIVFPANGDTIQTIPLSILPDELDELNETFRIQLTDAINARITGTGSVNATIIDNDPVPAIRIFDSAAFEGAGSLVLRVGLSRASAKTVSVNYRTTSGTATAALDYVANGGTVLSFLPGETEKWINIPLLNDGIAEPTETIVVQLNAVVNGTLAGSQGGDASSVASIYDGTGDEEVGNSLSAINGEDANQDITNIISIKVLPNPSSHQFLVNINTDKADPVRIRIIDLSGKVLEEYAVSGGATQLRVGANWKSGMYLISVYQSGSVRTLKLVKAQ